MGFFDRFKKPKNIEKRVRGSTSNLNPLYVARLVDIPDVTNYYTKTEIDNKFTQLDGTNSAKVNRLNDFTQLNRFHKLVELKKPANQANYLYLWDSTNDRRVGYFGKASASNDNITVAAERGDLVLTCSSGEIKVDNKRIAQVANPTADYNAANKKYVDSRANILDTKINENVRNLTNSISTNTQKIETNKNEITTLQNNLANANIAAYTGDWNSSKAYKISNIVSYNNHMWLCVKNNTNQPPSDTSTYWKILTFTVDTSNFAKLSTNSTQIWNNNNTFTLGATFRRDVDLAFNKIFQLNLPTSDYDAANKKYVDSVLQKPIKWWVYANYTTSDVSGKKDIYKNTISNNLWYYWVKFVLPVNRTNNVRIWQLSLSEIGSGDGGVVISGIWREMQYIQLPNTAGTSFKVEVIGNKDLATGLNNSEFSGRCGYILKYIDLPNPVVQHSGPSK